MRSIALAIAGLALLATTLSAAGRPVDIQGADGVTLKGTFYPAAQPGPGMLLVHQCNMDRTSWEALATDLVDAGIHVLTFDLRGFGETPGEGLGSREAFQRLMMKSPADVDAAYEYLVGQSGVDRTRIGVGGASCGVALSADLATRQTGVRALLALSGPTSDTAKQYIATHDGLAVFAAAAEQDDLTPGVHDVLQTTVAGSKHSDSMMKVYGGTEHGLPMFAKNPELEPMIVGWLRDRLVAD